MVRFPFIASGLDGPFACESCAASRFPIPPLFPFDLVSGWDTVQECDHDACARSQPDLKSGGQTGVGTMGKFLCPVDSINQTCHSGCNADSPARTSASTGAC